MNANRGHPSTDAAVGAATFAAAAMIAQQVAAKAARDALFLESFDVDLLPRALGATALLAIPTVLGTTRLLARYGPIRVVPAAFLLSALLQFALALLATARPGLAAALFYVHVGCLGAVLVSGFWSVVNERFDPNTARHRMARIGTGATLGGVVGGLGAVAAGRILGAGSLLPLLAGLHLVCAVAVARTGRGSRAEASAETVHDPARGLRVVASQPYLRHLVLLVISVTAGAACLDFVFKDLAQERFGAPDAPLDLVTFFAVFHTGLSVITLVLQSALTRRLLDRSGLASAVGTLPAGLGLGAVALLLVPGWPMAALARVIEAGLRSSVFRSAYELLYTPLPAADKRAGKAIIDVGGERAGDAAGAALVQSALLLLGAGALGSRRTTLLLAAALLAVVALALTRRLHRGYVTTLENSLRRRHVALHREDPELDLTTRTLVMRTPPGMELDVEPAAAREGRDDHGPPVAPRVEDRLLRTIEQLRSGDPRRVLRTLATHSPLAPELIGHVVPLLAWDAVAEEAVDALRATGRRAAGALLDATLDPDEEFSVRRRAPRGIDGAADPMVVAGLIRGLEAERFEIRFQCARTLHRILDGATGRVDPRTVMDRVLAEVSVPPVMWDSQRLLDRPRQDLLLREHAPDADVQAPLLNVFMLLSLVLPTEPLRIALQGILSDDAQLRGTAREYLESVLPTSIRERLFTHLDRTPPRFRPTHGGVSQEVLRTHLHSHPSLREELDAALRSGRPPRPDRGTGPDEERTRKGEAPDGTSPDEEH